MFQSTLIRDHLARRGNMLSGAFFPELKWMTYSKPCISPPAKSANSEVVRGKCEVSRGFLPERSCQMPTFLGGGILNYLSVAGAWRRSSNSYVGFTQTGAGTGYSTPDNGVPILIKYDTQAKNFKILAIWYSIALLRQCCIQSSEREIVQMLFSVQDFCAVFISLMVFTPINEESAFGVCFKYLLTRNILFFWEKLFGVDQLGNGMRHIDPTWTNILLQF